MNEFDKFLEQTIRNDTIKIQERPNFFENLLNFFLLKRPRQYIFRLSLNSVFSLSWIKPVGLRAGVITCLLVLVIGIKTINTSSFHPLLSDSTYVNNTEILDTLGVNELNCDSLPVR